MDFTPAFASSFLSWHAYIVSKENNVGNSKDYFIFFGHTIPHSPAEYRGKKSIRTFQNSKQDLFTYANPPVASIIAGQETLFKNTADAMSTGAFNVMPFKITGKNKIDYRGNSYPTTLAGNR